ncbi:MAG: hypothetical protein ABL919_04675 [Methylococcales bacterium]|nr:hypothetical protein [Methylococcaceae bacterium]
MSKIIDKHCDDKEAGIRFHISSATMAIKKLSYVAFQRYLDQVEHASYRCPACKWGGLGKHLVPMEADDTDLYSLEHQAETWYACPKCEAEIDLDHPVMRPVD